MFRAVLQSLGLAGRSEKTSSIVTVIASGSLTLTLLCFSVFSYFLFVLMNSKLVYGFEKLHEKTLSPLLLSCRNKRRSGAGQLSRCHKCHHRGCNTLISDERIPCNIVVVCSLSVCYRALPSPCSCDSRAFPLELIWISGGVGKPASSWTEPNLHPLPP